MKSSANKLLLRNARIVTPQRTIKSGELLIDSGTIADISESLPDTTAETTDVDLRGLTLFPGFIDIHIHGAAGIDTMEATADDLRRVAEFLARHGVTSWLPTLVPAQAEQYERAVLTIAQAMAEQARLPIHARVLGVHYEGPFVNSAQCGALHREHFRTFNSPADVDTLPTVKRDDAVHLMTLAPEVDGGLELISELNRRGWIVSIGHTRANRGALDEARNAGVRHMTHFMNAMTPLHQRDLGAVGWGLIHDDVTIDMIADGIHLDREVLRLITKSKGVDRVSLISDSIAAAGQGDGDYEIWGEKIIVRKGRTSNARGSIAGSVITMLDSVRMMLSLGFSEPEVARMASLNPARLLGTDRECGSIEEGKRADLVALDENQNVRLTIIGGQITHQS
jgi:N-acetylglucosamine-6-phosphate deacetylase